MSLLARGKHSLATFSLCSAAACAVIASVFVWGPNTVIPPCFAQDPPKAAAVQEDSQMQQPLNMGLVDFESLIKETDEYAQITQLDEQIQILEDELKYLPLNDQRKRVSASHKKMEQAVIKAKNELQAEYEKVNSELSGLSSHMAAQLDREGKAISDHYQGVLKKRLAALQPKPQEIPKDAKFKMDDFMADLAVVREQRVASRRLELERSMQARLDSERVAVDTEIAAFDNQIMKENQEKRLNLQLRLQTASTPEAEAEVQKELNAISDDEAARKDARHDELLAAFDAKAAAEKSALEAELNKFNEELTAEARSQAYAERDRIVGKIPTKPVDNNALAQAQISEVKATINAEMESRKAQLAGVMQQRSVEAKHRLEAKQKEIRERLESLQSQLETMVQKSASQVSGDTKKKMDDVQAKLDDLKKQRKELYEMTVDRLKGVVAGVAEKQGVSMVLGAYIVNIDCKDITDLSMVALKQSQH